MADAIVLVAIGVVGLLSLLSVGLAASIRRTVVSGGSGGSGDSNAAVESRLDELSGKIDAVDGASGSTASTEGIEDRLDDLAGRVDDLADRVSESGGADLSGLEERTGRIDDRLGEMQSGLSDDDDDADGEAVLQAIEDLEERIGASEDGDADAIGRRLDDIEGRLAAVQEGLSEVAGEQTVKQPLVNIDDRLQEIDQRLTTLREGVSADEDSSLGELLSALDSEISAIDQRLDDIESAVESGEAGTVDFAGTASSDSNTSGFLSSGNDLDGEDFGDVEEEFDFDEEFLGVEDEEDAV